MGEWKEYKLGDIVSIASGFAYKGEHIGHGDKLLLGMGCVSFKEKFLISGARPYCGDCAERYLVKSGDIVLATRQQSDNLPILGMPAIIPEELKEKKLIVGANLYRVTNNSDFDNKYIYWLLKTPAYVRHIASCKTGTTVAMITKADIENFVFIAPDKLERQRILETISSLDDKIDLLHRENAILEVMAETIFRQWFIEEANGDDISLGEVVKTTSGGTPSRKKEEYYCNGNVKWVKSKELHHSYILETEEKITEYAVINSSAKLLPVNSVLIAMYGATVGEYGILAEPMTCNQAICALIPNDNYPYTYLYLWAKYMQGEFINLACGAAQQNISQELIKQQYVSNDLKQISDFHILVAPYMEKMKVNQEMINTLNQMRDGLLPKLMNREISIYG